MEESLASMFVPWPRQEFASYAVSKALRKLLIQPYSVYNHYRKREENPQRAVKRTSGHG